MLRSGTRALQGYIKFVWISKVIHMFVMKFEIMVKSLRPEG